MTLTWAEQLSRTAFPALPGRAARQGSLLLPTATASAAPRCALPEAAATFKDHLSGFRAHRPPPL